MLLVAWRVLIELSRRLSSRQGMRRHRSEDPAQTLAMVSPARTPAYPSQAVLTGCVARAVTYALPGLQPGYGIPTVLGGGNHTALFTKAAATLEAHRLTLNAAKGIAVAGFKVVVDAEYAKEVKAEWEAMDK